MHGIVDFQMIGCSCSVLHVFVVSLFDMMSPLNVEFMCLFLTLFRTGIGTKAGANLSMFICPSLFLRRFISDWISLSVLKCHLFLKFSFHRPSFFLHAHLHAFPPASELCFLVMFSFPRCSKFQIFQDCSAAYISFNAKIFLVALNTTRTFQTSIKSTQLRNYNTLVNFWWEEWNLS